MKVYVIQTKNGIMMNVGVGVKNLMIGNILKMIVCGILLLVTVIVISHAKLKNI